MKVIEKGNDGCMSNWVKKIMLVVCMVGVAVGSLFCFNIYSKASDVMKEEKSEVVVDEEKAKAMLNKFLKYMHNEQYEKVIKMFSENKEIYTKDVLKEFHDAFFLKNEFVSLHALKVDDNGEDGYIIQATIKEKYRYRNIYLLLDKNYNTTDLSVYNSIPIPEEDEYYTEEYVMVGSLEEYPLYGLLTLPNNNEKPPVVILVHGSGAHDADESMGSNRIFAEIAHGLAKQGIATVRYNERFHQYPYLAYTNNTIYTEAIDDAVSIVDQIGEDDRIDSNNIYVAGHSLGGMVAPKIAELNSKVSGIISLAGTPRVLYDLSLDRWDIIFKQYPDTYSKEDQKTILQVFSDAKLCFEEGDESYNDVYLNSSKSYVKSLNELNTPETLKKLSIPMLILQGEDDFQVLANKDYIAWKTLLKGRNNCEFKLYEGLNHFFMKSQGYGELESNKEYLIPSNIDQRVIDDIAMFINKYSN